MIRKRILWIEDDAYLELGRLATQVHLTGEFDLDYALSATEAVLKLRTFDYDAVVVDVRIPPGNDKRWIRIYYDAGATNRAARLGVHLLLDIFEKRIDGLKETARDVNRYGVLSMDVDAAKGELESVGVTRYRSKNEGPRVLLMIIREILTGQNGSGDST